MAFFILKKYFGLKGMPQTLNSIPTANTNKYLVVSTPRWGWEVSNKMIAVILELRPKRNGIVFLGQD